jgi:DNA-binding response OmpR family regulator
MESRQRHVLYIEDHDDTRELVTLVLAERNYRVTTGTTLADAFRLAGEHHFDLYILDSWLPDGSGIDLCRRLREFNPCIPILFLSGAAYEADKEAAINSGAQRYLIKPANLDVLCNEVGKLIDVFPIMREPVEGTSRCSSSHLRASEETGLELNFAPLLTTRH